MLLSLTWVACHRPSKISTMHPDQSDPSHPLLCDTAALACSPATTQDAEPSSLPAAQNKHQRIEILYFTDPICSSCWGIEPQLRLLKLQYGHGIHIDYRMGGLLPDWSYNSGGISQPSDVATHWDEVSPHYDMPIDGDLWLEDPLHSSYPPSIAFKAAQIQAPQKAQTFLRRLREMVFLEKKNITKAKHLSAAATYAGLDATQLLADMEGPAVEAFEADLALAKTYGVRGFPTLFINGTDGDMVKVYGAKPYTVYRNALLTIDSELQAQAYSTEWADLFQHYPSLTAREYAELSGMARDQVEGHLDSLTAQDQLTKFNTKNGAIWKVTKRQ